MTPPTLARILRQQAEATGSARRQLPGGLLVHFARRDGNPVLTLTRREPGRGGGGEEKDEGRNRAKNC